MIEINLQKLERGTREGWVTVKRGGKIFRRRQRLGTKKKELQEVPPSPMIIDAMKVSLASGEKWGFTSIKPNGDIGYDDIAFGDEIAYHADFKIRGNTITNINTGRSITLTDKFLSRSTEIGRWKSGALGILSDLDSNMGFAKDYNNATFTTVENEISNFKPEYSDLDLEEDDAKGKYTPQMGLKTCTNVPQFGSRALISNFWYNGEPAQASLIGSHVKDIFDNKFNKNNILHLPLKLMMETSKKIAKKYGADYIYRGETNIKTAKSIIESIVSDGSVELASKTSSWSENEKLSKWYAVKHTQTSPSSGTETKSNVMIRLNKDKYINNVVFDYRACGNIYYPEQEITLYGKNIKLTGDDVMVYTTTPKRKTKKWITLNQYISEDGNTEKLISQMEKGK